MPLDKTLTDLDRRSIDLDKYYVREILPSFFQEDYPLLINLLEYYYEFLEESGNVSRYLNDLYTIRDVKQAPIELLKYVAEEVLLGDPYFEQFVDQRLSVLFSNTLYRSKGTKFGIESFFKLFFNVDAEVEYPKKDIFFVGEPQKEVQVYDTSEYFDGIVSKNFLYVHAGDVLVKANNTVLVEDEDYILDTVNQRVTILDTISDNLKNATSVTLEIIPAKFSLIGVDLQEKKLINDKLYQLYSLLIKSSLPSATWVDAYRKFVHPAGMYFQSQVQCFSNVDMDVNPMPFSIPENPELLVQDLGQLHSTIAYTDITGLVADSADASDNTGFLSIPLEPNFLSDETNNYADTTIEILNRQYGSITDTYNIKPPTGDEDSAGIGISRDSDHFIDVSNAMERIDQNFYDDSDGSITN